MFPAVAYTLCCSDSSRLRGSKDQQILLLDHCWFTVTWKTSFAECSMSIFASSKYTYEPRRVPQVMSDSSRRVSVPNDPGNGFYSDRTQHERKGRGRLFKILLHKQISICPNRNERTAHSFPLSASAWTLPPNGVLSVKDMHPYWKPWSLSMCFC